MGGIWLSPTKFMSFEELAQLSVPDQNVLLEELYSGGALGGFNPVDWLGLLPDPDPVLQKTGDGIAALRALTADPKVVSSIQSRKLGTLKKRDYVLEPGAIEGQEPDPEAVRICADLEKDLEMVDLYNVFSQVLDAPYYGLTVVEIIWKPENGRLRIDDLKPRPVEWFGFNAKHEPVYKGIDLMGTNPIPFGKAVLVRHFPDCNNPYGLRLLSRCLWPVAIKKGGIKFWTMLCERFGIPWVIGEARPGAQKTERQEIAAQLASMVRDAVAVVSGGTKVNIHGIEGKGSGSLHSVLIEYMDKTIAWVLQGQTLTSDIGKNGARAASETHREILGDYREADETLIDMFMEELSWVYTQVNSPAALSPGFRFREPEDYTALADLDNKLYTVGVRFKAAHFERRYQLSENEFYLVEQTGTDGTSGTAGDEAGTGDNPSSVSGSQTQGDQNQGNQNQGNQGSQDRGKQSGGDSLSAAGTELATTKKLELPPEQQKIEDLILSSETTMTGLFSHVQEILESSASFDEAKVRILEMYADYSPGEMAVALQNALLPAGLFGRYVIQQQVKSDGAGKTGSRQRKQNG